MRNMMVIGFLFLCVSHGLFIPVASAQLFPRWRALRQSRFESPPIPANPSTPNQTTQPRSQRDLRVLATPFSASPSSPQSPRSNQSPGSSSTRRYQAARIAPGATNRIADATNAVDSGSGFVRAPVSLGVSVMTAMVRQYQGLEIVGIDPRSRVAEGGLRVGDVIVKLGDQRILSVADVSLALREQTTDEAVEVQIFRGQQLFRTNVMLISTEVDGPSDAANESPSNQADNDQAKNTERDSVSETSQPQSTLGIDIQNASSGRGVDVVSISSDSAGALAEIRVGDRLVSVDGRMIARSDDLVRDLARRRPGDTLRLGLIRNDRLLELRVPLRSIEETLSGDTESTSEPQLDSNTPAPASDSLDPLALPADEATSAFSRRPFSAP
ncbi:MAG: PDZ domain-containing protein [Planctomycetota bacterium]